MDRLKFMKNVVNTHSGTLGHCVPDGILLDLPGPCFTYGEGFDKCCRLRHRVDDPHANDIAVWWGWKVDFNCFP